MKCCNQEAKLIEQRTFSYYFCEKCRKEVTEGQGSPWVHDCGTVTLPRVGWNKDGEFQLLGKSGSYDFSCGSGTPTNTPPRDPFDDVFVGQQYTESSTGESYAVDLVNRQIRTVILRAVNGLTHVVTPYQLFAHYYRTATGPGSPVPINTGGQTTSTNLPAWVVVGARCQSAWASTIYTIEHIDSYRVTISNSTPLLGVKSTSTWARDSFLSNFSPAP